MIPPVTPGRLFAGAAENAGSLAGFDSPHFCGGAGGCYPEVPDTPEIAGWCLPEFPEVAEVGCGEYGVGLN